MATFVSIEYVIANALILLKEEKNKDCISIEELSGLCNYLQKKSNEEENNAIFMYSLDAIASVMCNFSKYFKMDDKNQTICIMDGKNIKDLKNRFIGYIPFDILFFMVSTIKDYI